MILIFNNFEIHAEENLPATAVISTNYEKPFLLNVDLGNYRFSPDREGLGSYCSQVIYPNILCDNREVNCPRSSVLLYDESNSVVCLEYEEAKRKILQNTGFLHKERVPSNFISYPELNKEEMEVFLQGLNFKDITWLISNFPIQENLYVSSDCPICFDLIDEDLLLEMVNSVMPEECGEGVIYENCVVVLNGNSSQDPEDDEIINYRWTRVKPDTYGIGVNFYNTIFPYGPREIGLDGEPNMYHLANLLYSKYLGECCLFDLKFHAINGKLIFQAPEVIHDIPLTFGLQVKDSGTQEFGEISKMTLRIRDLDAARVISESNFNKSDVLPTPSELCIANKHEWNEEFQYCATHNWVHCNGIGGELITAPDEFLEARGQKVCVF